MFYQEGVPFQYIQTKHERHSEMGKKHLMKTITHSWRVGTKIMKQSTETTTKQTTKKEGRANFFLAITRKIDTSLPALVVALCSNRSICFRQKSDAM